MHITGEYPNSKNRTTTLPAVVLMYSSTWHTEVTEEITYRKAFSVLEMLTTIDRGNESPLSK